jgi:hypothetical protein
MLLDKSLSLWPKIMSPLDGVPALPLANTVFPWNFCGWTPSHGARREDDS